MKATRDWEDDDAIVGTKKSTKAGTSRVEPSLGRNDFELDDALVGEESFAATGDIKDVLMDAPSPRARRRAEPVQQEQVRPERSARRAQGYERVTPQGRRISAHAGRVSAGDATKADRKKVGASSWRTWLNPKWILGVLLLASIVGLYAAREPIAELMQRPLKSVVVEGEFNFVSKARATDLIAKEIDNNFIRLDLMRLKTVLMTDPWVDSVSLTRRWPDTLVVKIVEQKPIARWSDGFLNQRGQIVKVKNSKKLSGLPWLQGDEAFATEILQQYQDLAELFRLRGLDVLALKCDSKKSWRLTLNNGAEIVIGRDQVMEKMRRFVTVYDKYLASIWSDVKSIDVRYSNGVAVRWVEGSESAKKYLNPKITSSGKG